MVFFWREGKEGWICPPPKKKKKNSDERFARRWRRLGQDGATSGQKKSSLAKWWPSFLSPSSSKRRSFNLQSDNFKVLSLFGAFNIEPGGETRSWAGSGSLATGKISIRHRYLNKFFNRANEYRLLINGGSDKYRPADYHWTKHL